MSHCIYHASPRCRHIATKQSALIARATYILTITVVALRIIARTKVHAAVWYPVISTSAQAHTVMQYPGSGDVNFFPHHTMWKWASPSLSLVALWIVNPPYYWYKAVIVWTKPGKELGNDSFFKSSNHQRVKIVTSLQYD